MRMSSKDSINIREDESNKHENKHTSGRRKKTHAQFMSEIQSVNPNIEILGEYKNSKEKIRVRCKICNNIWEAAPSKLLLGRSCPPCGRQRVGDKRRNNLEKVTQKLKDTNPNIEIVGKYVSVDKPIECKCLKCGFMWYPTLSNLYAGKGCPKCSGTYHRTHEEFVDELRDINPNIEVVGEFVNTTTKVECKCVICGYVWKTTPSSLLQGTGCRNCAHNRNSRINRVVDDVRTFTDSHELFVEEMYKDGKNSSILLLDNMK